MRLAFMGTPAFCIPVLSEIVAAGHDVAAVYTRAPQRAGRGKKLRQSPVHDLALEYGLEVRTPANFKDGDDIAAFRDLNLDVAVVAAYGLLLPESILSAPRHGCLNLHASLLPRWRGAAPIQRAIMAGDKITGVQVMQMEKGLDTGPILLSETTPIGASDTAGTLHDKLAEIAGRLTPRALAALERGALQMSPQSDEGIIYAHKITNDESEIDWSKTAAEVDCHIRGLSPFPGAWFDYDGVRVKTLMSRPLALEGAPGEIRSVNGDIVIACADGAVAISKLQRAGKTAQSGEEFSRGFALEIGQRIGRVS